MPRREKIILGSQLFEGGASGLNIHPMPVPIEADLSIGEGEKRPIPTGADILAGNELGAALPDQDTARGDKLPAIPFDPQSLAYTVASVSDASLTFLVCHKI